MIMHTNARSMADRRAIALNRIKQTWRRKASTCSRCSSRVLGAHACWAKTVAHPGVGSMLTNTTKPWLQALAGRFEGLEPPVKATLAASNC